MDILVKKMLFLTLLIYPFKLLAGVDKSNLEWSGSYECIYVFEHAPGAPAPAWEMHLIINNTGSCEFFLEGFEMDEDIICELLGDSKILKINFIKYKHSNTSGEGIYKLHSTLFYLHKLKSGEIFTKWGSLNIGKNLKDGHCFERND